MGTSNAEFYATVVFLPIALLVTATILRFAGKAKLSCLMLVPLVLVAGMAALWKVNMDMGTGGSYLLAWDAMLMVPLLALLALLLFAVLHPERQWAFWIALMGNASICGLLVWVAYILDFPALP